MAIFKTQKMDGRKTLLLDILKSSEKLIVPVYQRNYSWKRENCKQLFDDLICIVKDNRESHFFGSIVTGKGSFGDLILIDGQQRVTTVSLLIIAMINVLKEENTEEGNSLLKKLNGKYIIDEYSDGSKVRLKPFRNDLTAYEKLITESPSFYDQESKVTQNYHYFYNRIIEKKEISVYELEKAIQKLECIHIELGKDDDAQLIFESLNSTGLDLSESDKIRNYILMRVDTNTQEKYYDHYWNKIENYTGDNIDLFVRDYLLIKKVISPNLKKLYFFFKDYVKDKDTEGMLQDMMYYAEIYHDIKTGNIGSEYSNRSMKYLELLDTSYAYTFLMTFIDKCRTGIEPAQELDKVMNVLETYIFRRMICDLPTNALGKIFPILDSRIESLKGDSTASYSDVLIYQLQSYAQTGSFPNDEEFKTSFIRKDCYRMRKNNRMYLFDKLENQNSKERNNVIENMESNNYTIEHIMPQTLTEEWRTALGENCDKIYDEWIHTIANLTITAYNSNYSNASFAEKKTCTNGFKESGLRLNAALLEYKEWTENELKDRQKKLLDTALELWSYPATTFEPPKKADKEDVTLADDVSFTNTKLKSISIRGFEIKEDEWAKAVVRVFKHLYDIDPSPFHLEVANSKNVWFIEFDRDPAIYRKIAEGVFFCTQSDTNTKIRIIRQMVEKFGIDKEEVVISLKE